VRPLLVRRQYRPTLRHAPRAFAPVFGQQEKGAGRTAGAMAGGIEADEHETICIIVSHEFRTRRSGCHDFTELRAYLDKPNMRQNDKAWDFWGRHRGAGREGRRPDLPTWVQTLAPRLDAASDSHPGAAASDSHPCGDEGRLRRPHPWARGKAGPLPAFLRAWRSA